MYLIFLGFFHLFFSQPERLEGVHYSVQSDIWSLGLSLIEMAIGVYPIPPPDAKLIDQILSENLPPPEPKIMSFFAQLEHISTAPAPRLEHKSLSPEFTDFLDKCLQKEPEQRADLKTLLVSVGLSYLSSVGFPPWKFQPPKIYSNLLKFPQKHPWIKIYEKESVDIAGWVCNTMKVPPKIRN